MEKENIDVPEKLWHIMDFEKVLVQ